MVLYFPLSAGIGARGLLLNYISSPVWVVRAVHGGGQRVTVGAGPFFPPGIELSLSGLVTGALPC